MDCTIEELMQITAGLKLRLEKCEKRLLEREKDVVFLKQQNKTYTIELEQLKQQLQQQQQEQHDFKQLQVKIGNLSLKHVILEQKIDTIANQLSDSKAHTEDEYIGSPLKKGKDTNISSIGEDAVIMLGAHGLINSKDPANHQYQLMDNISMQITSLQEEIQRMGKEAGEKYAVLCGHITNLENMTFCDYFSGSRDVSLEWRLDDFQYHMDRGIRVFSPIFFTQLQGYRFQLMAQWTDEQKEDDILNNNDKTSSNNNDRKKKSVTVNNNSNNQHININNDNKYSSVSNKEINNANISNNRSNNNNDNNSIHHLSNNNNATNNDNINNNGVDQSNTNDKYMGLFLLLHRGKTDKVKPFNIPYTFQVQDKEGNVLSKTVSLVDIMFNRASHTILPGDNRSAPGHGFPLLLKRSDLPKYVVNDMLSVRCKLG